VLLLDGRRDQALIPGWYNARLGLAQVTGEVNISAGKHVLELYTVRGQASIGVGPAGATSYRTLTEQDSDYEAALVKPGQVEARQGTLTEACLASVDEQIARVRFADARDLCRLLRGRFADRPKLLERVERQFAPAGRDAYERNWLTEGKLPSRAGFVASAKFAPPLRLVRHKRPWLAHDKAQISSGVWVDGGLVYGLPFEIESLPWAVTSAICVSDNVLYVGKKNGTMNAVDIARRRKVWSFTGGGSTLGCPLLYRGVLYFGCIDRRLYALDATLGVERWRADLKGQIVATASCDGQRVYVGTRAGRFFAVGARDGKIAWQVAAAGAVEGGSCLGAGLVCFGDKSGKVHAINVANGQPAWASPADVGGPVATAPIRVGAYIYGGTTDGKLFGIEAATGKIVWTHEVKGSVRRPPLFAESTLVFVVRHAGTFEFRVVPPRPEKR